MTVANALPSLPKRRPDSHKGDYGHVLVLAGSRRMAGTAILTARAAMRAGAGLVTLGIPHPLQPLVVAAVPSAMTLPLPSTPMAAFAGDAIQPVMDFISDVDAVALGPGITMGDETATFATRVAQRAGVPLVLDADGINCIAKFTRTLKGCTSPRVLTPHPGEAGRLLRCTTADVQRDRTAAATDIARKYGTVVALKGHRTVIADGERTTVNETGNAGMATGGAGDVLTGVIAGLLAQGMDAFDAAVLGVHVHGLAGDIAAREGSPVSLIADDLVAHLGAAFRSLAV